MTYSYLRSHCISGKPSPIPTAPNSSAAPSASTIPAISPAAPPMSNGTTMNAPMAHRQNAAISPLPVGAKYGA